MIELKITGNEAHQRLDRFLRKYLKDHPLGEIYKNIRTGNIKVNGQKESENFMVAVGDKVQIYMDDIEIHKEKAQVKFEGKSEIIDIVFEDENMLVVNKPVGMLTHPDKESDKDTLIDRVQWYLRKNPGTKSMTFAPSACNRLDRNTAGLVIVAKNYASLRLLNKMIRERKISKYYLCIVKGSVKKDGEIKETLVKDERKNKTRFGRQGEDEARDSHTIYKILMKNNNYTLLEVELVTGRPHQIRAHFSGIGYPLYGDIKYGATREAMDSQFLFAYKIHFNEGEDHLIYLNDKTIQCPLPKEFEEVMGKLFDKNKDTVKKGSSRNNNSNIKNNNSINNNNSISNNNSNNSRSSNYQNRQPQETRTETRTENRSETRTETRSENSNYKGIPRVEGQRNGSSRLETERSYQPRRDYQKPKPFVKKAPVNTDKEISSTNEQTADTETENADARFARQNGGKPGFSPNNKNKKFYGDKSKRS